MTGYLAWAALVLAAAALLAALWEHRRAARTLRRLEEMVEEALAGDFSEEHFEESRLSALESRLARYLSSSALSARNLQAQKDQISALISDISHQTRTPVANLRLYAQLLEEQPLTPQGQDCAHALSAQAQKLQALIEALVKTSRLESGILALHPRQEEIEPLARQALEQYLPLAGQKGIRLIAGPLTGSAVLDAKWTEEALCNLLDNALKYTPAGGSVRLQVQSYELFAAIRVSDTGPGIPEEQQARIFSRFWRAPGAWQTEGVGIGLYLTRQIAEKQGGYVKVESKPGQGSTFSLCLPRELPKGG